MVASKLGVLFLLLGGVARAGAQEVSLPPLKPCYDQAVAALRERDAEGAALVAAVAQPLWFSLHLGCEGKIPFELPRAVHESVHERAGLLAGNQVLSITERSVTFSSGPNSVFILPDGSSIQVRAEYGVFGDSSEVRSLLTQTPGPFEVQYRRVYLNTRPGERTRSVLDLLNELNAYTFELRTALRLRDLYSPGLQVTNRDGVAALMEFIKLDLELTRRGREAAWKLLTTDRSYGELIRRIWREAELALRESCKVSHTGVDDAPVLKRVLDSKESEALRTILGRKPDLDPACGQKRS